MKRYATALGLAAMMISAAAGAQPKNFADGLQARVTGGVSVPVLGQYKGGVLGPAYAVHLGPGPRPDGNGTSIATIHNATIDLSLSYPVCEHVFIGLGYEMSGTFLWHDAEGESIYGGKMYGYQNGERFLTTRYSEYQALYVQIMFDFTKWSKHRRFKVQPYIRGGYNFDESYEMNDIWYDKTETFPEGDGRCQNLHERLWYKNNGIVDPMVYTVFGLNFSIKLWSRLNLCIDVHETGFLFNRYQGFKTANGAFVFVMGHVNAGVGLSWNL